MKKEIFNKGIEELQLAFPQMEMTKKRAEIWYKYSKDLTDEKWVKKIANCIQNCYKNSPVLADILNIKEDKNEISKKYRTV